MARQYEVEVEGIPLTVIGDWAEIESVFLRGSAYDLVNILDFDTIATLRRRIWDQRNAERDEYDQAKAEANKESLK